MVRKPENKQLIWLDFKLPQRLQIWEVNFTYKKIIQIKNYTYEKLKNLKKQK